MYQVVTNDQGLYPQHNERYLIVDDQNKVHIKENRYENAVRHCLIMNKSRGLIQIRNGEYGRNG